MGRFQSRSRVGTMNRSLNNPHKSELFAMAMCLFVVTIANSLAAQQSSRALFNGKYLDGWQQIGPGSFVVKDGMMKTEGEWACFGTLEKRFHMPPFELCSSSWRRNPTLGCSSAFRRSQPSRGCPSIEGTRLKLATGPTTIRAQAFSTHL